MTYAMCIRCFVSIFLSFVMRLAFFFSLSTSCTASECILVCISISSVINSLFLAIYVIRPSLFANVIICAFAYLYQSLTGSYLVLITRRLLVHYKFIHFILSVFLKDAFWARLKDVLLAKTRKIWSKNKVKEGELERSWGRRKEERCRKRKDASRSWRKKKEHGEKMRP